MPLTPDFVEIYATAGFALFPLRSTGETKKPAKGDWQKTVPDAFLTWADFNGKNYGVNLSATDLVIDVDCHPGKADGKASFAKLTKDLGLAHGWEDMTYVVRTGSGGYHIYLRKPAEIRVKKDVKDYPGIQFLSKGCYVVGAGSIHPDTNLPYEVVFRSPTDVSPAPAKIFDFITAPEVITPATDPDFVDDDPMNIQRFIELLSQMPEVPKGNQRNSAYIAACRGHDLGLSQLVCSNTLKENYNGIKLNPPIRDEEIDEAVRNAYKYAQKTPGNANAAAIFQVVTVGDELKIDNLAYDLKPNGALQKTLNNAVNHIISMPELAEIFRLNSFTGNIELMSSAPWYKQRGGKGPNVTDEDTMLLKYHLSRTVRVEYSRDIIWEAAVVVGHRRHYHPVRNYLNSLVWDGIPRIDKWLMTYTRAVDTPYTRAVSRKVLCAAVRRIMEPGCKWDNVLILEGAQGIGKSTVCRILGRMWAGDMNIDPHSKDAVHTMSGKWVIELSEMTALRWSDAAALKSFLSRATDTVRLSYERHAKDFPRQSIFIGTVNPEHVGYLNDTTGNRRYWIVHTPGPIDILALENDCNQLWAEAMRAYKTELLYLQGEAERTQVTEALNRMPEDPMKHHVLKYIQENPDVDQVAMADLCGYVGIPSKNADKGVQQRLATAICDAGWEKKRVAGIGGVPETVYCRPVAQIIARQAREL